LVTVTGVGAAHLGALIATAVSYRQPIAWPPTATGETVLPVATGYPRVTGQATGTTEVESTTSNTSTVTGPGTTSGARVTSTGQGSVVAR
jgi:hypothetical protein